MRWVVSYAHKPGADGDYVSITTGVVRPQCIVRGKRASPTMTAAVSTILEELLVMLGAVGCSGPRRRGRGWGWVVTLLSKEPSAAPFCLPGKPTRSEGRVQPG